MRDTLARYLILCAFAFAMGIGLATKWHIGNHQSRICELERKVAFHSAYESTLTSVVNDVQDRLTDVETNPWRDVPKREQP